MKLIPGSSIKLSCSNKAKHMLGRPKNTYNPADFNGKVILAIFYDPVKAERTLYQFVLYRGTKSMWSIRRRISDLHSRISTRWVVWTELSKTTGLKSYGAKSRNFNIYCNEEAINSIFDERRTGKIQMQQ